MARGGYRPNSGPPKGTKYRPRGSKKKTKPDKIPQDIVDKAEAEDLSPLEYMLNVMNDELADKNRRDRMAIAAAPFIHSRKGEGLGKKDEASERAKTAGAGRFSASASPKLTMVKK